MAFDDRTASRPSAGSSLVPFGFLLLIGVAVWWFWPRGGVVTDPNAAPRTVSARGSLAEEEKSTIELFQNTSPCVVHITTLATRENPFSLAVQQVPQGT